jgi:hypothetical protein
MIESAFDYSEAFAVIPHDTNKHVNADGKPEPARALYIGVAGDVTLVDLQGTAVLFKAVPVGLLRVGSVRVNATGTTATNIVGLR